MTEQFANLAQSALAVGILAGDTSLSLDTLVGGGGANFSPIGTYRIIIDSEIIMVGARSGNTLSSLTRGAEGTVAASHLLGAQVTQIVTAGALNQLQPLIIGNVVFDNTTRLSFGTGVAGATLEIDNSVSHFPQGVHVRAYQQAYTAAHVVDWNGAVVDLVDLFYKSQGDGIFVAHQGGVPQGGTGGLGGNSGFNCLIPYYIDDPGAGWNGAIVNDHTGMQGFHVESQAQHSQGVHVAHFGDGPGILIVNQTPHPPETAGNGIALSIVDSGSKSSLSISKLTALDFGAGIIYLQENVGSLQNALVIADNAGVRHTILKTDGSAFFGLFVNQGTQATMVQIENKAAGIQRNLSLSNANNAANDGVQIDFVDTSTQQAKIQAVFVTTVSPRNGELRLSVIVADVMKERLRLDTNGISFYDGATLLGSIGKGGLPGGQITSVAEQDVTNQTETDITNCSITVRGGSMSAQTRYHIEIWGNSDDVTSNSTITIRIYYGGVQLTSTAITAPVGTNKGWKAEANVVCRLPGGGGSSKILANLLGDRDSGTPAIQVPVTETTSVSTLVDQTLKATVQSNSANLTHLRIEEAWIDLAKP